MKTRKEILNEMPEGTPPPLMSAEGAAAAAKLGNGLTFEAAISNAPRLEKKPGVTPGSNPASKLVGTKNAMELASDEKPLALMSEAGKKLAANSAPRSAHDVKITKSDVDKAVRRHR